MNDIMQLCEVVRQTSYDIHTYFGHGYLEKVYENSLAHRLRKAGFTIQQQFPINVHEEDGTVVGEYFADLIVDTRLIIELKAARALSLEHEAQVLGYLKATSYEHGLLINFGSFKFSCRKYIWSHTQSAQ